MELLLVREIVSPSASAYMITSHALVSTRRPLVFVTPCRTGLVRGSHQTLHWCSRGLVLQCAWACPSSTPCHRGRVSCGPSVWQLSPVLRSCWSDSPPHVDYRTCIFGAMCRVAALDGILPACIHKTTRASWVLRGTSTCLHVHLFAAPVCVQCANASEHLTTPQCMFGYPPTCGLITPCRVGRVCAVRLRLHTHGPVGSRGLWGLGRAW